MVSRKHPTIPLAKAFWHCKNLTSSFVEQFRLHAKFLVPHNMPPASVALVFCYFAEPNQSLAQANIEKIGKARTVVRQMKTLGKTKKLAKAEAKLAKLKAKEVG